MQFKAPFVFAYFCSLLAFSAAATVEDSPEQQALDARTEQIQNTLSDIQDETAKNLDVAQQNADALDDDASTEAPYIEADYSGENQ